MKNFLVVYMMFLIVWILTRCTTATDSPMAPPPDNPCTAYKQTALPFEAGIFEGSAMLKRSEKYALHLRPEATLATLIKTIVNPDTVMHGKLIYTGSQILIGADTLGPVTITNGGKSLVLSSIPARLNWVKGFAPKVEPTVGILRRECEG